jgi:hypothetical protein
MLPSKKIKTISRSSEEHTLGLECIAWFRNEFERFDNGCVVPVPNELAYKRKDTVIKDGCSDLIVLLKEKIYFIELKVKNNKQQDNQIHFQKLVENLGFQYKIIKSIDEFKNIF